jgi:hypothetical protein
LVYFLAIWYIFVAIWYILWPFFPVLLCCTNKVRQPCFKTVSHLDRVGPPEADELTGAAEPGPGGPRVGHVRVLEAAHADRAHEVG